MGSQPVNDHQAVKEAPLLPSQWEHIFRLVQSIGFNPADFQRTTEPSEPNPDYLVTVLRHRPSGYKFVFDFVQADRFVWVGLMSPGRTQLSEARGGTIDQLVELYVKEWIQNLRREIDTPDLWTGLASTQATLNPAALPDNSLFNKEEQSAIFGKLAEIEERLIELHGDSAESRKAIREGLETIRAASTRLGRKDFVLLFMGQLLNMSMDLALNGDNARRLVEFAVGTYSGISGLLTP